jgi:hypothetical protein
VGSAHIVGSDFKFTSSSSNKSKSLQYPPFAKSALLYPCGTRYPHAKSLPRLEKRGCTAKGFCAAQHSKYFFFFVQHINTRGPRISPRPSRRQCKAGLWMDIEIKGQMEKLAAAPKMYFSFYGIWAKNRIRSSRLSLKLAIFVCLSRRKPIQMRHLNKRH